MSKVYREPSIDATYQVSVHLAKRFQRWRFFRNQPIRNKNCLWWPCLLTYQDEMSKLIDTFHRCFLPSFCSFRGEDFFRNRTIRNQNCLWRPCLSTDQDKMSILYRGPFIDASDQVSFHLDKQLQRIICLWNRPIRNKNWRIGTIWAIFIEDLP
jgi:hypothetical protein